MLDVPLRDFLDSVAARQPTPSGGAVIAVTVAAAAGLTAMAARFSNADSVTEHATVAESLRRRAETLAEADAEAYAPVLAALRRPTDDPRRSSALENALAGAAKPPLKLAATAMEVAALAAHLAASGNRNLRGDAISAALLAAGAARAAARLVRINLESADLPLDSADEADRLAADAARCADRAEGAAAPAAPA